VIQGGEPLPTVLEVGPAWRPLAGTEMVAALSEDLTDGSMSGEWPRTVAVIVEQRIPLRRLHVGFASDVDGASLYSGRLSLGPIDLNVSRHRAAPTWRARAPGESPYSGSEPARTASGVSAEPAVARVRGAGALRAAVRGMRPIRALLAFTLLTACSAGPPAGDGPGAPPPAPDAGPDDSRPWSLEGLTHQPRLQELRESLPPGLGFSPGTTRWRPLDPPPAAAPGQTTPGALIAAAARVLGMQDEVGSDLWEQTVRVWTDDDQGAIGVVLRWGFLDDSIAGHDVRLHLRSDGDAWTIEGAEERYHCRRGISPDDLCL